MSLAVSFAETVAADGGEKYLWAELIAFDNAAADHGVDEYLARMPVKPRGISFLLTDPEIVHAHTDLSKDFPIGDQQCSYCARPWNEERKRQAWTVWQLRGLVAELDAYCRDRMPSSYALLAELLHRGASLCAGVRVEEALADESMPLLILNPAALPADELAALRRRTAPVVTFGAGAPEMDFGPVPKDAEPTSWLWPLPMRAPSEASYARAVAALNAVAFAVPDGGMADLRVMSYRTADGRRIVVALNDRATYLTARIRLRERPRKVRALTASPSLPVEVAPQRDGASVLTAKIPPQGVVVLECVPSLAPVTLTGAEGLT